MSRNDDERVTDILEAADGVAALVAEGREAWEQDWTRQLATERLLEIIGEAARAMTESGKARYPAVPWRKAINARTVLAHQYHRVDMDLIWNIASQDIPDLVELLLQSRGQADQPG